MPSLGASFKSVPPAGTHANDVLEPAMPTTTTDMYQQFPTGGGGAAVWAQDLVEALLNCSALRDRWNLTCDENGTLMAVGAADAGNLTAAVQDANATGELFTDALVMGVTSVFLGLMILITVIGNVFVIAAILLERNLQNVANYLIVSLAVADLMVACLVMPLGAVYEISQGWILGPELCDMWTSSDVLCCTASILHLVAIAVDRYWAVTNVDYIHTRNSGRIGAMIVIVWVVALVVSLAPQFGWKDPDYLDRINIQQRCLVSQDVAYQIFATCSTFYVPLLVILVLYWKIFQTARKRIRRRPGRPGGQRVNNNTRDGGVGGGSGGGARGGGFLSRRRFLRMKSKKSSAAEALVSSLVMVEGQSTTTMDVLEEQVAEEEEPSLAAPPSPRPQAVTAAASVSAGEETEGETEATTAFTITKPTNSENVSPEKSSTNNGSASHQSDLSRLEILAKEREVPTVVPPPSEKPMTRREKKESLEAKRERKAAKTLAIITGAFVVCWLPFFIMALWMPLCTTCEINNYVASFFLWLGYFNSTLNPVIYTIFSPEFRQAFKRILCGGHRRAGARNFRSAKLR